MIEVLVTNNTSVSAPLNDIEKRLTAFLKSHGINSNAEVSVLVVNKEEMLGFVKDHLKEEGEEAKSHPVLSFVQSETEGPFKFPPDGVLHLGEIIVSVDHANESAKNEGKDVNDVLYELIEHGALHLLGIHHK